MHFWVINIVCDYSKEKHAAQKTVMLKWSPIKLSGYLGFQFLLTSPSPFVPPENPMMRNVLQFLRREQLTDEGVMRHIEGCIVQGGDVVSFWGRPLNVSAHLAILSSQILLNLPLCLYLSSDPSFSVELLSSLLQQQCLLARLAAGY